MSTRKDFFQKVYRFKIEINGLIQASFCDVSLPESTNDLIKYREGTSVITRKIPCVITHKPLVLKRGITNSMELFNWQKMIEQGQINSMRKNFSLILLDEEGNETARWNFTNAWPNKCCGFELNEKTDEISIETLEITFETMQRIK